MGRPEQKPKNPSGLYYARRERGTSKTELARLAKTNKQTIDKLEASTMELTRTWAERFEDALGYSAQEIMFWDKRAGRGPSSLGESGATIAPATNGAGRKQGEARRVAKVAYPVRCCVVCGLQVPTCLTIAHLDHNAGNNAAHNLAFMCQTHHWMYDAGLYPIEAVLLLRAHWQQTEGKPSHKHRMKDAGAKAARTRKLSARAKKAWATRRNLQDSQTTR